MTIWATPLMKDVYKRQPLRNLLEISKTKDTVKNIGEKLYHFLEEANVKDHIKELVDSYSEEGEIALSEEYSQIRCV